MTTVRCVGVIHYTREAANLTYEHIAVTATDTEKAKVLDACRRQQVRTGPSIVGFHEKVFDMSHDDVKSHHWPNRTTFGTLLVRVW